MVKTIFTLLFLGFSAFGQQSVPSSPVGLTVGEKVPQLIVHNLTNYSNDSVRLTDFNDKLLILDFWATWCSSCVAAFPKNELLKRTFKGKLEVIGVTDERSAVVSLFLNKKSKKRMIVFIRL